MELSGQLGQCHGCWCPGDLCRQGISSHSIDHLAAPHHTSQWLPKIHPQQIILRMELSGQLGQCHGCWCPGHLCRQGISSHSMDPLTAPHHTSQWLPKIHPQQFILRMELSGQLGQCHGCWCPGHLCCQGISSHSMDPLTAPHHTSQWLPKIHPQQIILRMELSGQLGQCHGCWCPGHLCRQGISSHSMDPLTAPHHTSQWLPKIHPQQIILRMELSGQLGQCHGCWCPGHLCCQGISSHSMDPLTAPHHTSQWLPKIHPQQIILRMELSGQLGQCHGCWCPGHLCRQGISSHSMDPLTAPHHTSQWLPKIHPQQFILLLSLQSAGSIPWMLMP